MKVGVHASESLTSIVERKRMEERETGRFLWGYGGSLCHPRTQVGPIAESARSAGVPVAVFMIATPSKHQGSAHTAAEFSTDGTNWEPLPDAARVLGSTYALVCRRLRTIDDEIDLASYVVAVGAKRGTPVPDYLRGRIDKVCAVLGERTGNPQLCKPAYVADLIAPYAVFLR